MSRYCEKADLYKHGLRPGALPNPGRMVADVSVPADIFTLDGHALATDDPVTFRAEAGGSLPSPLVAGTTYYAKVLTDATFHVAAAPGGSRIDLTTAGSNIVMVADLPFVQAIESASARVDNKLIAHGVPLDAPYPPSIIEATAHLAIAALLEDTGGGSRELIDAKRRLGLDMLSEWSRGQTIRGAIVPGSTNQAVTASGSATDPRGWAPAEGGLP